jgi:hypothetical protein
MTHLLDSMFARTTFRRFVPIGDPVPLVFGQGIDWPERRAGAGLRLAAKPTTKDFDTRGPA